jgi:hypothetical protein
MAVEEQEAESNPLPKQLSEYLERNKDATNEMLYEKFSSFSKGYIRKVKMEYFESLKQGLKRQAKLAQKAIKLPKKVDFYRFCKTLSYPDYYGAYKWQLEAYDVIWNNKISEVVVPRDHGKSIDLGDICEWVMQYQEYDVLYLGWTDKRKQVAENVFNFFSIWEELDDSRNSINSRLHFKIKNGGRFDTYSVTSKDTLGMHSMGKQDRFSKLTPEDLEGFDIEFTEAIKAKYLEKRDIDRKLLIIIDDPIDETFRLERWKETKLEMKFNSTIANINPDKLVISGTRKFLEDFFYFIELKYGSKLAHYRRRTHLCTPHLRELDIFKHIDFYALESKKDTPQYHQLMDLLTEKARDHPCYNPNLSDADLRYKPYMPPEYNLLCPERWTESELREKREEIGEYWWHAEYEGNPHPVTGSVWDKVTYTTGWKHWKVYDLVVISLDRALTTNIKSSWTGMTITARERDSGMKLVIKDLSGQYDFDDCLDLVQEQFDWLRKTFLNCIIAVVVEKQGGGDDFMSSAHARKYKFASYMYDVHQTRDKIERIKDYLRVPINRGNKKNGLVFLDSIRNSELMKEVLEFPYPARLDAIDSLATGIKKMEDFIKGRVGEQARSMAIAMENKSRYQKEYLSPIYNNPVQNPNFFKSRRAKFASNAKRFILD